MRMIKKSKAGEILSWLPIAHGVFAFAVFLIVPTMRYVYFGTPYYWYEWDAQRCGALFGYLFTSGFVTFFAAMAKAGI